MAGFRCYLLDGGGRIVASEEIEAADASAAVAIARELLAERQSHAFELWQGDQRIHKEERNIAGT